MNKPRVLLLSGYFDWFSGYQETGLAAWFSRHASIEVVASDRVNPIFSDAHIAELGVARRYQAGTSVENDVEVTRFSTFEKRSMVWSTHARRYIASQKYDIIIQVTPGQLLPVAGTLTRNRAFRIALYGDNRAMWSHLSCGQRLLKGVAFAASKGALYSVVNYRADAVYGCTPNTVSRLRRFSGGKTMSVLPLAFDPEKFYFDAETRQSRRRSMNYAATDTVIMAAGKFQVKKRLDLLLNAFEKLAAKHAGLKLLVVGADDSSCARDFRAQINRSPLLVNAVTVLGFVDATELNAIFNAADIGVWPRMPAITIQQAMGTGLKVVLPENDLMGHLILSGSGAYFAESEGASLRMETAIASQLGGDRDLANREQRAAINAWLGADRLPVALLRAAGFGGTRSGETRPEE